MNLSYKNALERIKQLNSEIEQLDGDLDSLIEKVKEVKSLVLYCEGRIMAVENEIHDIFEEE